MSQVSSTGKQSKQTYRIKTTQNIMWVKVEVFNFLDKGRRVKDMMLCCQLKV